MSGDRRCRRRPLRGAALLLTVAVLTAGGCRSTSDATQSASAPAGSPSTTAAATTTTTTITAAPPTTTAGPAPEGPVGNPWPRFIAAPAEHHAILTMGDSLMGGTTATLERVLKAHGFDAVVYDGHVNASGLLDPMNGFSAREYFELQLNAHPDVDTVVFEWLGVCVTCSPDSLRYGSPDFYVAWMMTVADLVDDARRHGVTVVWAVPPPPPPDVTGSTLAEDWSNQAMRVAVATQLAADVRNLPAALGIPITDWWQALSDTNGQWQYDLWYDGALHSMRLPDRVHLSDEGSIRASTWTAATLAQFFNH